VISVAHLVDRLMPAERPLGRPWIVAVDGRSGSGKSTLATRIHGVGPPSAVVHTDDVAWHYSFFDWTTLLIDGVLSPLHRGTEVCYRPPGWEANGRMGAIAVPRGLDLVIVEGVGAGRSALRPWIDRCVWVQSDRAEAKRRGVARDGGTESARAFWEEWEAAEVPFIERERPWEWADVVVLGTPRLPHDPDTEVIISLPRKPRAS
jgi:uridine kinase